MVVMNVDGQLVLVIVMVVMFDDQESLFFRFDLVIVVVVKVFDSVLLVELNQILFFQNFIFDWFGEVDLM